MAVAAVVMSLMARATLADPLPSALALDDVEKLLVFCAATMTLAAFDRIAPESTRALVFTEPVE